MMTALGVRLGSECFGDGVYRRIQTSKTDADANWWFKLEQLLLKYDGAPLSVCSTERLLHSSVCINRAFNGEV